LKSVTGNTVAVTGATGFVGRVTLDRLLESGWKVRALTRSDQPKKPGVIWIAGALDNAQSLQKLCEGVDAVLHIAGVVNAPDSEGFEAGNVTGTASIIAAARNCGVKRFVHVSSLAAKHPQLSLYGASKYRAEKLVGTSMLGMGTPTTKRSCVDYPRGRSRTSTGGIVARA
jgi:UDP-glucose 4-epimerase